jgi:hypothetical protein
MKFSNPTDSLKLNHHTTTRGAKKKMDPIRQAKDPIRLKIFQRANLLSK